MRVAAAWWMGATAVASAAMAQPQEAVPDAARGFAVLKTLQGQWTITRDGKRRPYAMTYDVASRNSIVTEQFGHELSVFYIDGNRLLMTHFCNAGNQPRLELRANGRADVLDFVMFDFTGLAEPGDPHVREVIYRMVDPYTIRLSLVWTGQGAGASEDNTLGRPH